MNKPNFLLIALKGFNAAHPISCPFLYGTDEYQAWMLGFWLWCTGEDTPRIILQKTDCLWFINGFIVQWEGIEDQPDKDRKREFVRQDCA